MKILLTGAAGFIGSHVAHRLLGRGDTVVGLDNLNAYYDPQLKRDRLQPLTERPGFSFVQMDVEDRAGMPALFERERFDRVVHLAAQAGVRYSIDHPLSYGQSNLVGFLNMLEACRQARIGHLVYASSSSVYGSNSKLPFSEDDRVDTPVSLYAATKRANELMAHSYSHLYALPTTGLRFFTVYGPWGRPDMAYYAFTRAILEGRAIDVYNHGRLSRDFTYIDDVVGGLVGVLDQPPPVVPGTAPYRLFNIGNHQPVSLLDFIACIEAATGRQATMHELPMQSGDVLATYADVERLAAQVGFAPSTPLQQGIERFVAWYREYHA
jgi:UDP-glucuronate 4-epimerase